MTTNRDFEDHGFTIAPSVPSFDFNRNTGKTEYDDFGFPRNDDESEATKPDSGISGLSGNETQIIEGPEDSNGLTSQPVVVGWLVGIDGEGKGNDYRLHSGYNRIGRGENMDIPLTDKRISREAALEIAYDSLSNAYFANSGGGKCLSYINRKLLMGTQALAPFDRIQLAIDNRGKGEIISELLFVPLCGEKFSWAEMDKDEIKKDS